MGKVQSTQGGNYLQDGAVLRQQWPWAHRTPGATLKKQETTFRKSQNSQSFETRWCQKKSWNRLPSQNPSQWVVMKDDGTSQKEINITSLAQDTMSQKQTKFHEERNTLGHFAVNKLPQPLHQPWRRQKTTQWRSKPTCSWPDVLWRISDIGMTKSTSWRE